MKPSFESIRIKAKEISSGSPVPGFYTERKKELSAAENISSSSSEINFAKSIVGGRGGVLGHGFRHAEKVAIDAGAIIYCEHGFGDRSDILAGNAIISGYLHDIRRDEKDHPRKAAGEVRELFRNRIDPERLDMISFAISNHEAFREHDKIDNEDFMLCAGALYDADKFRWGPDNFTDTIWDMAKVMKISLEALMTGYERGINGIIRIKSTFRTETGKKYGPDIIDAGLKIGEELYKYYVS
jgi:hypothetical protein